MEFSLKTRLIRLASELVIVFLGVYLAFLFNGYGKRLDQKRQQVQLLEGLHQEVAFFLGGAQRRAPKMREDFIAWQKKVDSGEKVVPLYFVMEGDALPTNSMWQVALNVDGINLLDVTTMYKLAQYYTSFDIMLDKYRRLIDFAEAEIIPHEDNAAYFFKNTGEFRAVYAAYVRRYADFLKLFETLTEDGLTLKAMLEKYMKKVSASELARTEYSALMRQTSFASQAGQPSTRQEG